MATLLPGSMPPAAVVAAHEPMVHRCRPSCPHKRALHPAGHESKLATDVKTLPHAVSRVLACCQSLLQVRTRSCAAVESVAACCRCSRASLCQHAGLPPRFPPECVPPGMHRWTRGQQVIPSGGQLLCSPTYRTLPNLF